MLSVDPPEDREIGADWAQVLQPAIPQPTSFRKYRSLSTFICVRKLSVFQSGVDTLDNFASSSLFEKLPLGYHSLCARSLTDGDFDHGRKSAAGVKLVCDKFRNHRPLGSPIKHPPSESDGFTKLGPKARVDLDHVSVKLKYYRNNKNVAG